MKFLCILFLYVEILTLPISIGQYTTYLVANYDQIWNCFQGLLLVYGDFQGNLLSRSEQTDETDDLESYFCIVHRDL